IRKHQAERQLTRGTSKTASSRILAVWKRQSVWVRFMHRSLSTGPAYMLPAQVAVVRNKFLGRIKHLMVSFIPPTVIPPNRSASHPSTWNANTLEITLARWWLDELAIRRAGII